MVLRAEDYETQRQEYFKEWFTQEVEKDIDNSLIRSGEYKGQFDESLYSNLCFAASLYKKAGWKVNIELGMNCRDHSTYWLIIKRQE